MRGGPATTKRFAITLDRVLVMLLLTEGLLLLSDQYDWFAFYEGRGWTVLIAAAVVAGVLLLAGFCALATWTMSRWIKIRPFQFGLRSGLLMIAVVAVICGWFASAWHEGLRQREVLQEIGASVTPGDPSSDPPASIAAWLEQLLGEDFFTDATEIWLRDEIHPETLQSLLRLPKLKHVILINMKADDQDAEALRARGIQVETVYVNWWIVG